MDINGFKETEIDTILKVHLFKYDQTEGEGSSKPLVYDISQKVLSNIFQTEIDSTVVSTYGIRVKRGERRYFKSILRVCDVYSKSIDDKTFDERFSLLKNFIQYASEILPKYPAKDISEERIEEILLLLKEDEDDSKDKDSRWLTKEEVDMQFLEHDSPSTNDSIEED
jgi:hypothetical protein